MVRAFRICKQTLIPTSASKVCFFGVLWEDINVMNRELDVRDDCHYCVVVPMPDVC